MALHLPCDHITQPEKFSHLCRLEIYLSHEQLLWATIDAQCEAIWRVVAAPSSVENLTVDSAVPMLCGYTYGPAQLSAALETPGMALRHITFRGVPPTRNLASTVVAMASQLQTLRLVELDSFLYLALDNKLSTDKVALACRQFQFSSVGFIPPQFNASELLVAWDRMFSDPRLRRIIVSSFRSGRSCHRLSTKTIDPPPPPPLMVPGRRVTIELRDRTCRSVFNWNGIEWLKRLTGTASELEFRIDAASPYASGFLGDWVGVWDSPWTHATLHLALLNWSMLDRHFNGDPVDTIARFLDLIAPTMSEWMTAQRNYNVAKQMKVYAHLDDDVLPNITNEILMTLLQRALELWNNEQNGAVRLWLKSYDIIQLVRGPLTPLE